MTEYTEWHKDLGAIAFDVSDLVQRVRSLTRAARHLSDDAPSGLEQIVSHAAFNLGASIVLIESAADAMLAAEDVNAIPDDDDPHTVAFDDNGRRVQCVTLPHILRREENR